MLVVLSEIDCRNYLIKYGIYPDDFFMDLDTFKSRIVMYENIDILVIFGGMCNFRRRRVCEYISKLRRRSKGKIVKSIEILSDATLPSIDKYYKYMGTPSNAYLYSGWDKKGKDSINILERYITDKKDINFFPPKHEKTRKLTSEELKDDELIKLVQVPVLHTR